MTSRDPSGAMSRRKQLKPRALKRELEEEGQTESSVTMTTAPDTSDTTTSAVRDLSPSPAPQLAESVTMETVTMDTPEAEDEAAPGDVAMVTEEEEEEEEEGGSEEYRCETCDLVFPGLTDFMDHRNYDCAAALEGAPSWHFSGAATVSGSDAPASADPDHVTMERQGGPNSEVMERLGVRSPVGTSPDDIPCTIGVTEMTPYNCLYCEKAFGKVDHLRKHEQIHADVLPYKCHGCPRLFKFKQTRDRHARVHASQSKCHASLSRRDVSRAHLKPSPEPRGLSGLAELYPEVTGSQGAHDLSCVQCGDRCLSAEELHIHVQTHSEELAMAQDKTVLSCPFCAEIFIEEEVLELHIEQTHTIESVNKCHLCSMCFLDSEDLGLHLKSHETAALLKDAKLASSSSRRRENSSQLTEDDLSRLDCPYCQRKGFTTLGMLNVHIRTMHAGLTDHLFSCQICHVGFATSSKLAEHTQKDHAGLVQQEELEIKFPCDYCTLEFNSSDVLRTHKGKVHKITDVVPKPVDVVYCSQCTMGFPHIYALAEHMHNVHGYNNNNNNSSSQRPSPTAATSKPSASPGAVSNGHLFENLKSPFKDPRNLSPGSTSAVNTHNESYLCDFCNSTFHNLSSYQTHLKEHPDIAKYQCSECQAEFTSDEQLENHTFVHYLLLATQYGCTSCLKLFSKPDELQKHLMDIHAHHLYRCSLCKEVFDSKVNIQVHFAIKHSNECKLYKCSNCGSVFRSEMEWQLHVKVYHLGMSKPYRCFFCRESFTSEADLQSHIATHKKQFPCPLCDEAFHVEYLLDKHLQVKHSPDGVKLPHATKLKVEPPLTEMEFHFTSPTNSSATKGTSATSSPTSAKQTRVVNSSVSPNSLPQPKKGDLMHKCEICDVKFCDESTLQKHRVHDHGMSPEMQLVIQKSQQAKAVQQQAMLNATPKGSHGSSEKFSQLCVYCNQTFKTKGELEKHMKTHVTPSNQKCNICDEIFPSASILAEHKLTHCKVVKGNVCVVCKVAMKSEEQFYTHSQQHGFQGTNMQCVVCRQTLASMLELQMHARHHFQNATNFFTCCVCVKSFNSKENLISKLNANGRTYYVCKPCYHGETPLEHRCPQCEVKFENKMQLEMHMLQHQKTFQCIKCQQSFGTEYEIQMHVATHVIQEGNVHECKICCQIFDSPAKLQCHLIEHTFEKTDMKCYICGLMFTQATGIQMHVLEHGVGARQYSCTQCPQKFFFSAELQNHMFVHTLSVGFSTNPEYRCPECAKAYPTLAQLKSHMRTHKKDPTLQCSLCMEPFSTMVELQQHFFLAHSGLDFDKPMLNQLPAIPEPPPNHKKPAQCAECGKEFPSINSLQGHMRVHSSSYKSKNNQHNKGSSNTSATPVPAHLSNGEATKHSCPDCGKELSSAKNLAFHMRVHTGEKPYECPVCHKRFSRKENRRSHMKTHSGEKPYTCPVCHRRFSRRCHVKEHIKVHFTQPSAQTCETCGDLFSHMRTLRRHQTDAHGRAPEFTCKLCSEKFASGRLLRHHAAQTHHLADDLMEVMSVASDEDGDADADTSDSLGSEPALLNGGQENMDPDREPAVTNGQLSQAEKQLESFGGSGGSATQVQLEPVSVTG